MAEKQKPTPTKKSEGEDKEKDNKKKEEQEGKKPEEVLKWGVVKKDPNCKVIKFFELEDDLVDGAAQSTQKQKDNSKLSQMFKRALEFEPPLELPDPPRLFIFNKPVKKDEENKKKNDDDEGAAGPPIKGDRDKEKKDDDNKDDDKNYDSELQFELEVE